VSNDDRAESLDVENVSRRLKSGLYVNVLLIVEIHQVRPSWSARPVISSHGPLCNYVRSCFLLITPPCADLPAPSPLRPPPSSLQLIMSPDPSYVDVLIVGAGPAGLMCANALARAGVNVRVIDRRCAPVYSLDVPHSPLYAIGQSRLLLDRQTASNHGLSKSCRVMVLPTAF
jgi:hypothetical protein